MAKPAVLLGSRFLAAVKSLGETDIVRVEEALRLFPECFGQPHLHTGISIRRLKMNIFECRAGLKIRILFRGRAGALEIFFVGNHNEVRRLIHDLQSDGGL